MTLQKLLSRLRKAAEDYNMIQEGDRIAVGLSGGKDSTTLLFGLNALRRFYPESFDLEAITVDLGYGMDLSPLTEICSSFGIRHTIIKTQISEIVFDARKEKNPCSLCSKMRKGALNDAALSLGCNKTAYAHHRDDMVETMMLSLLFEGRFYCFPPVTNLDKTGLTVIRPLMYVPEKDITGFKNKYDIPVIQNPCPADGNTKRGYVKSLIKDLNREHPGTRERLFNSIVNANISDWPQKP